MGCFRVFGSRIAKVYNHAHNEIRRVTIGKYVRNPIKKVHAQISS